VFLCIYGYEMCSLMEVFSLVYALTEATNLTLYACLFVSFSLHPNGYSMLSGGLDRYIRLWDLRSLQKKKGRPVPVHTMEGRRSVSSAFYSPSGRYVVCTTLADSIDVWEDIEKMPTKPLERIHHDNQTGRWLSTFMARWHPQHDVFCVGSMTRPRCIELWRPRGLSGTASSVEKTAQRYAYKSDVLTAVSSRCCFHPTLNVIAGGNSSGRVAIVR
jgi:WD repeat-containing protein 76